MKRTLWLAAVDVATEGGPSFESACSRAEDARGLQRHARLVSKHGSAAQSTGSAKPEGLVHASGTPALRMRSIRRSSLAR